MSLQVLRKFRYVLILGLLLTASCKSKEVVVDSDTMNSLENALKEQNFEVSIQTVFPFNTGTSVRVINSLLRPNTGNNANRIDVQGQGYQLLFQDDTIKGDLPYFGEQRQSSNMLGSKSAGISLNDAPENYEVKRHETKKDVILVNFTMYDANQPSEFYEVTMHVWLSKNVRIQVSPNTRTFIKYTGNLRFLEE